MHNCRQNPAIQIVPVIISADLGTHLPIALNDAASNMASFVTIGRGGMQNAAFPASLVVVRCLFKDSAIACRWRYYVFAVCSVDFVKCESCRDRWRHNMTRFHDRVLGAVHLRTNTPRAFGLGALRHQEISTSGR